MRILYIHQYFATRQSSTGTRSYEFAKYLVSRGHSVTMVTGSSRANTGQIRLVEKFDMDGINVISVKNKYDQKMTILRRILAFVQFLIMAVWVGWRQRGNNVVLATSTPLTVGLIGLIVSKVKRIPLVFEVRDLWPDIPIKMGVIKNKVIIWLTYKMEALIYKHSAKIVALSPGMVNKLIEKGVMEEKVSLITNCSNLDLFSPSAEEPGWKKQLGLEGKFVCIHSGSMGIVNGVDIIINTAEVLQSKGDSEIVFLLVGEGSQKELLIERISNLKLNNVIIKDAVAKNELPKHVASADLGIMTVINNEILWHNSANKFFDYLSSGLPIVINYGGWQKDVLENYQAGFVVPPKAPEEFAEALLAIKADKARLVEMGRNARKLAEKEFDQQKLAGKLEEVLIASLSN